MAFSLRGLFRKPEERIWYRPAVEEITVGSRGGLTTSAEKPMTIPAVYQAIRLISTSLASLPIRVYQREGKRRTERPDHPASVALGVSPNDAMTATVFRETVQSHVLGWGNGFSRIIRDNRGEVDELIPLHPSQVALDPDYRLGDPLAYYVMDGTTRTKVEAADMLHVPALGAFGVWGYSPISLFRTAFELSMETEEYGRSFFANGASPSAVLKHPGEMKPKAAQRLRESWTRTYGGSAKNRHKVAVLEEGMDFQPISLNPEDAQFLETRKFQLADIARIYNVPAHMLGDLDRATFSNIEHQSIEFVRYSLRPWATRWTQELNRKLFGSRRDLYCEHDFDDLLAGDTPSRFDSYSKAITDGWLSRNEVRERENLDRVESLDEYLVPLNMAGAGDEVAGEPESVELPDADEEAARVVSVLRPVLRDAVGRVVRASEDKRARAAKSDRLDEWRARFTDEFPGALHRAVMPAAESVLRAAVVPTGATQVDALSLRLTEVGRFATNSDEVDADWILNLIEGAILDIAEES